MRKVELQIPEADERWDYRLVWEPNYELAVSIQYGTPIIKGNAAGLISLAKILLLLAQAEAQPGDHIHFDAGGPNQLGELDEQSASLIISRA